MAAKKEHDIPALAVAGIERLDPEELEYALLGTYGFHWSLTPRDLAATELSYRYHDELFEQWGISPILGPGLGREELRKRYASHQPKEQEFGKRDGVYLEHDVYSESLYSYDSASAPAEIDRLIDEALKIADEALEEFKNGKLSRGNWGLSCGEKALQVRAELEVGNTMVAARYMYDLGRLVTKHELHEHEVALKKRKANAGTGGANSRVLTDEEEKAAAQKFRELYATSKISKTGAQERIGKEFGVSRQTIGRIVAKYPSEK